MHAYIDMQVNELRKFLRVITRLPPIHQQSSPREGSHLNVRICCHDCPNMCPTVERPKLLGPAHYFTNEGEAMPTSFILLQETHGTPSIDGCAAHTNPYIAQVTRGRSKKSQLAPQLTVQFLYSLIWLPPPSSLLSYLPVITKS